MKELETSRQHTHTVAGIEEAVTGSNLDRSSEPKQTSVMLSRGPE